MKIFWSWQSDTPGKIGRHLIREALHEAITELKISEDIEESIREELHLDFDRQGVPGSPDLAQLILRKIDEASIFVADVTLVGSVFTDSTEGVRKKLINSNVAIELGYAFSYLSSRGVLMVMNDFYGSRENLPFDLSSKAGPIIFSLSPNAETSSRRSEQSKLKRSLRAAIQLCIQKEIKANEEAKAIRNETMTPAVTANDWERLGFRFAESCRYLRADFQQEKGQSKLWRIAGGSNAMCEALLRKAGAMLLKSPHVFAKLSPEVKNETEDMLRWLLLLNSKGYSKFGSTYYNVDEIGIQTYAGYSGSIPDLALHSSVVCEECSSIEL